MGLKSLFLKIVFLHRRDTQYQQFPCSHTHKIHISQRCPKYLQNVHCTLTRFTPTDTVHVINQNTQDSSYSYSINVTWLNESRTHSVHTVDPSGSTDYKYALKHTHTHTHIHTHGQACTIQQLFLPKAVYPVLCWTSNRAPSPWKTRIQCINHWCF